MSNNAETTHERFVAKVNAFLSDDEKDKFERDAVAHFFAKYQEAHDAGEDTKAFVKRIKTFTAGTRVQITLSEETMQRIDSDAETLVDIFNRNPGMSVPRERTLEKITASLIEAAKEAQK